MVALIGGLAALVLGVIGLIGWWEEFIQLLMGVIPLVLLLGGALATYLGCEEMKDKRRAEMEQDQEPFQPQGEDVDKYKQEVAELKAKLASMETEESKED
jgi:uncharacterized membrane-anchored protein YhcB (DUF1043 family)